MIINKHDNSHMKQDALFAYLEFCTLAKIAPEKEVYNIIVNCRKGEKIDSMTSFIEIEDGNIRRGENAHIESFNSRFVEKYQPQTVELSQKVPLSPDSEKEVEQFVTFDPSDDWICLTHDGNDISLSLENYNEIVKLAESVISLAE